MIVGRLNALALLACSSLVLPAIGVAQAPAASSTRTELASIASYARRVDQFIKHNSQALRIFADVSSGTTEEPSLWREFKSEKLRAEADTGENLNDNAYVWRRDGKVIGVNFTFQSPSRDWVHYAMYYFRKDGTLAKIHAQLNTFYGNISVVRDKTYSSNGRLLRTTTRYLDLQTQKRRKASANFQDEPVPMYRTVKDLPFYRIL